MFFHPNFLNFQKSSYWGKGGGASPFPPLNPLPHRAKIREGNLFISQTIRRSLCNNTNELLRDVGTQKYCLLATSSNKARARLKFLWPFDLHRCLLGSRAFTAAILQHITMLFSRATPSQKKKKFFDEAIF
jgi:hypothetical protein